MRRLASLMTIIALSGCTVDTQIPFATTQTPSSRDSVVFEQIMKTLSQFDWSAVSYGPSAHRISVDFTDGPMLPDSDVVSIGPLNGFVMTTNERVTFEQREQIMVALRSEGWSMDNKNDADGPLSSKWGLRRVINDKVQLLIVESKLLCYPKDTTCTDERTTVFLTPLLSQ